MFVGDLAAQAAMVRPPSVRFDQQARSRAKELST
jgi:hypothetical protein